MSANWIQTAELHSVPLEMVLLFCCVWQCSCFYAFASMTVWLYVLLLLYTCCALHWHETVSHCTLLMKTWAADRTLPVLIQSCWALADYFQSEIAVVRWSLLTEKLCVCVWWGAEVGGGAQGLAKCLSLKYLSCEESELSVLCKWLNFEKSLKC